jgi:hypothetical protein
MLSAALHFGGGGKNMKSIANLRFAVAIRPGFCGVREFFFKERQQFVNYAARITHLSQRLHSSNVAVL